jgi:hypothetical protein
MEISCSTLAIISILERILRVVQKLAFGFWEVIAAQQIHGWAAVYP